MKSVEDLLETAKNHCADAPERVVGIGILLRHFRWHLCEDARLNSAEYVGYEVPKNDGDLADRVNAIAYWEELLERIQHEGVVVTGVRVCCNTRAKLRLQLDGAGKPVLLRVYYYL